MNNGDKRRNRKRDRSSKRYKVRYDRLVAAVLVLVVLIVVLASCAHACSDKDKDKNSANKKQATSANNTQQSSIIDDLVTSSETSSLITGTPDGQKPSESQYVNEKFKAEDIHRGDLVLVNLDNEYKFPEDDIELVSVYENITGEYYHVSDLNQKLHKPVLDQLTALMKSFYEAENNSDIYVIGTYRSKGNQDDIYWSGRSQFQSGYSDYHTGRSFDIGIFPTDGSMTGYYSPRGVYGYVDEHAAEYGFIVRFPEGKETFTHEQARTYTYRYVGVPHAVYMKQNNLCLEEYIDALKGHNNENPLEVAANKKLYQIYYVPANKTGDTEVPLPSNKTYSVSGNNVDGFIVTVTMN
ncbi:MAG: D-alanyl-D-alanine carboxypeptidase family protein [Ruminococcus sp.]|uniref:D-alanyl-D-alanine carboxypeptidase family protein n=1 Tax=Ruminococcus sp. TaxID=41978 RepID=UPI0025FC31B7|nr:D-alanyl-D-alanine carboxypeptidase family protein [Ruminococcus sp.]MBR5684383.1 D-alanyl-D-alanine carboxypeptidase family protein [Ruminococcus sp.]